MKCFLKAQGIKPGACLTETTGDQQRPACEVTLRRASDGNFERLIRSMHLSRPEDYFSVYQSGCNHACLKCHSAEFSKTARGEWISSSELALIAKDYRQEVTVWEPRERATMWHAGTLCKHCGSCRLQGIQSPRCPQKLESTQITLSPQGFGPARNIIAFTGGDLGCCPQYYADAAKRIKEEAGSNMWVLFETNGYALTSENLETLKQGGVDAFWLDIKAYDCEKHRWLTGSSNEHILPLPEEIRKRGFALEVLALYIPNLIEADELKKIAQSLEAVDPAIPFTILSFFPENQMKDFRGPSTQEMIEAYEQVKSTGLENIRLGNLGVFVRTEKDQEYLMANIDRCAY